MSEVLGVIPARGGSKGIPRKNLRLLAGRPLLAYTIEAALRCPLLTDVIVSTDEPEIRDAAIRYGVQVPFMRPAELASDNAPSLPVIQHAIQTMESMKTKVYDIVTMLQPTSPLRSTDDISACIEILVHSDADSVISIVDVGGHHPFRMKRIVDGLLINYIDQGFEDMRPRQLLPGVYIRNGALYVTRRNILMAMNSFSGRKCIPYIMPRERSINIDSHLDFMLADIWIRRCNANKLEDV